MFIGGEPVEVIVAGSNFGRRGTVGVSGTAGQPPYRLTVHFLDGKMPMDFKEDELRIIERPGEQGSPRLIPRDPVI
jgi:hypothetical protein